MYAATGNQIWNGGHIFLMGAGAPLPLAGDGLQKGGHGISEKEGPRRLSGYLSLISILELAICIVGKAHVTKMKLNLNFFPLALQLPQIILKLLYFQEARDLYKFNYGQC